MIVMAIKKTNRRAAISHCFNLTADNDARRSIPTNGNNSSTMLGPWRFFESCYEYARSHRTLSTNEDSTGISSGVSKNGFPRSGVPSSYETKVHVSWSQIPSHVTVSRNGSSNLSNGRTALDLIRVKAVNGSTEDFNDFHSLPSDDANNEGTSNVGRKRRATVVKVHSSSGIGHRVYSGGKATIFLDAKVTSSLTNSTAVQATKRKLWGRCCFSPIKYGYPRELRL